MGDFCQQYGYSALTVENQSKSNRSTPYKKEFSLFFFSKTQ